MPLWIILSNYVCRYLFWVSENQIYRALLDGTNVTAIVSTGIRRPGQLTVDITTGYVYWADLLNDNIQVY